MNQIVVISGAGSGIGAACAVRFAEAGATAEKTQDLATQAKDAVAARLAGERLLRYRVGQPYHVP